LSSVARQTDDSLTGVLTLSGASQATGAVPGVSSHAPPACAGSRQPLSEAHWKHRTESESVALSRECRQAVVLLWNGSQAETW
jgi:hypothetical protein